MPAGNTPVVADTNPALSTVRNRVPLPPSGVNVVVPPNVVVPAMFKVPVPVVAILPEVLIAVLPPIVPEVIAPPETFPAVVMVASLLSAMLAVPLICVSVMVPPDRKSVV